MDRPFCVTADPWFLSDDGSMVDSPGNGGSLIPVTVMVEILENITRMVKRSYTVDIRVNPSGGSVTKAVKKADGEGRGLLGWARWVREELQGVGGRSYLLAVAEVDSSLIAHNYDILDAYFMSLSDGAYVDEGSGNVLRLDYRTHLYVNQSNAALFIATSGQPGGGSQMRGLLNWEDEETVEDSRVVEVFSNILYQREKLKELGRFLGSFNGDNRKIEQKREEFIWLLAKAQADECIDSQVESEVFGFVYSVLRLREIRESVQDTMALVSEYSKERVYANLNFLSLITIPFVLCSTLFQMGMLKFKPALDLEAAGPPILNLKPWLGFLGLVLLITALLFRVRKKR